MTGTRLYNRLKIYYAVYEFQGGNKVAICGSRKSRREAESRLHALPGYSKARVRWRKPASLAPFSNSAVSEGIITEK